MRWTPGDRGDIEDMRGRSGFRGGAVPLGLGGFVLLLLLSWVSGTNLFTLLGTDTESPPGSVGTTGQVNTSPAEERLVDFVNAVTKDDVRRVVGKYLVPARRSLVEVKPGATPEKKP